jgi:hypothetical protein
VRLGIDAMRGLRELLSRSRGFSAGEVRRRVHLRRFGLVRA